jgi:hypothetical protein
MMHDTHASPLPPLHYVLTDTCSVYTAQLISLSHFCEVRTRYVEDFHPSGPQDPIPPHHLPVASAPPLLSPV